MRLLSHDFFLDRYIWIDSFCTVQDDVQDWLEQAAKMADVYSGAELTISAARLLPYDVGFLQRRQTDVELPLSDRLLSGTILHVRDCDLLGTGYEGINEQPKHHSSNGHGFFKSASFLNVFYIYSSQK